MALKPERVRELFLANVDLDHPGWGADPYADGDYDYPEAYANAGRAAALLGMDEVAERCAAWLLRHQVSANRHVWGLPWPWSGYDADAGFVYTTSQALHLLLDVGWPVDALWLKEHARRYGERAEPEMDVWNALAQAAGVLNRLERARRRFARSLAWRVRAAQRPDGLWPYSADIAAPDAHQALVMEGLILVGNAHSLESVDRCLDAVREQMVSADGVLRERPDDDQPSWVQHASLTAWCLAARGRWEYADSLLDALESQYVDAAGMILTVPGGEFHVRQATAALRALAAVSRLEAVR